MLFDGNGEEHTQETHRKVKRITMKVQLKEGVSASDIPRIGGIAKRIIVAFANKEKTVEIDAMPKGMDQFIEEVSPVSKNKISKEDK